MSGVSGEAIRYRRSRFSTRLPLGVRYSRSHFWLLEESPGSWRIGLTSFATRMLGEIVEFDFEVERGGRVELAETIGWIEGFKAVSDLISVATGDFAGANEAASRRTEVICSRPYGEGWLYRIDGEPDPEAVDVHGYVAHLDAVIDKMLETPWRSSADVVSEPET